MKTYEWAELFLLIDGLREAWESESEWAISPMLSYGQMHRESRGRGRVSKDAQAHKISHGRGDYKGAPPFTDRFQAATGWMPYDLSEIPESMPIRFAVARWRGKKKDEPARVYRSLIKIALGLDNTFPDVPVDGRHGSVLTRLRVFAAINVPVKAGVFRSEVIADELLAALWHIYNSTGALPLLTQHRVNSTLDTLAALGIRSPQQKTPTGDSARTGTGSAQGPLAGRTGLSLKKARV